jgi:hypothetical protein
MALTALSPLTYRTLSEAISANSEIERRADYCLNARLVQYQWYSIGLQARKWLVSAHSV